MKYKNIKLVSVVVLAAMALVSCSDSFLEEKKNYEQAGPEIYDDIEGATGRVNDVYYWSLPTANTRTIWKHPANGLPDDESKSTEEFSGFGAFVDPQNPLLTEVGNVPDYFQGQANNIQTSVWGRIRNINDVIEGISGGALDQENKDKLLGQVYFFRAWCYYLMFKWYGGVPLVDKVLPIESGVNIPRATSKQTFDFICADLDKAVELLSPYTTNGGWTKTSDYGRVTAGTAMALKGRIMVLWASPLFNRSNNTERWTAAYEYIQSSIPVLTQCGYGLYGDGNPGVNASKWANMFATTDKNPEAVFLQINNDVADGGAPDYSRNNNWENAVRPANTMGGGGIIPSSMIVDLFPMKDGKRPSSLNTYTKLDASANTYDPELPFVDRDPRFYRTFAFPGVRWAFEGDPTSDKNFNPYKGSDYILWNYLWYENEDDVNNDEAKAYGADNLYTNGKGFYVRKRSDDADVNSPCYIFENTGRAFKRNAAPFIELRYAEVLLNLAEAACGSGHNDVAVEQLKKVRERVGYTGDCGLQANLISDQAACMAAILYERQIEFAYEGKRFDDMRRWLLFDGGAVAVPGAPSSWTLTGWGGNTCTWLGVKPMNNQRRENLEFRLKDPYSVGSSSQGAYTDVDPILSGSAPVLTREARDAYAVDLRNDISVEQNKLIPFYQTYLVRKMKKGDSRTSDKVNLYIDFKPYYYFMGLSSGTLNNNADLEQTIGWKNPMKGNTEGTFDPLAE
ncbi:MAG: RagB/SusD family nutrient uptake outer membrane protein [Prevotella sp.]|nr:RagB/SusD family nutrient uptake outer membrane protein [Bacteroidales bacterium]MDY2693106.1 RagB/SusD family nutrient uptake outer membrane protein [Prevotella sp.]MDY4732574.1 RagB/SusD family nutrient uptake outer membrane protein [Prevotella sp.]MDY6027779.1 RagB/SusD family nutrient uptake outer membrane protein [Prevotella sp.]